MGKKFLILTGLLLLEIWISGCASMLQTNPRAQRPEVRDVPFQARGLNDESLRNRIIVLPFLSEGTVDNPALIEESRRVVLQELLRSRQFVLVRSEDLPQDPRSFLTPSGDYDMEKLAQQAGALGVAAVMEGKILDVKVKRLGDPMGLVRQLKAQVDVTVRVRVHSATNGRELLNDVRSASVESVTTRVAQRSFSESDLREDPNLLREALRKAFIESVPAIYRSVEKISWEGRIAMVSGERVFINAGRLSGIQVGDILKITEEGDEVFDPETGIYIGKAPGRMKGTVEVVSYFGKDGAIAILHSGSGFRENDRVELY